MRHTPITALLIIALTGCASSSKESAKAPAKTVETAQAKPAALTTTKQPLPAGELAFIRACETAKATYGEAANNLKLVTARPNRAAAIKAALRGQRAVKVWVGTLLEMTTTPEGNALVKIQLPDSAASLATWTNKLTDAKDKTLIDKRSPLFQRIANLTVGSNVRVSGTLFPSPKDFAEESSVTEGGSLTSPEFILKFSDITPVGK
jgi:hypothetical protein